MANMITNVNEAAIALRANGHADAADLLEKGARGVGVLCQMAGYDRPAVQTTYARADQAPRLDDCDDGVVAMIMNQYMQQCGVAPVRCLAKWIAMAVRLTSYAQVRDDFSIPDLALMPSGLTPTGVPSNGVGSTTFVSGFNVAPGQSILLKTQGYSLPFNPRCLWGALAFNGGADESNYRHILFKTWVGPINTAGTFNLNSAGPLYEWAPKDRKSVV